MTMVHKGTKAQRKPALLCVFVSLWLLLPACSKPATTTNGTPTEVTEVRIPRGAGGVGFLPLLVMEKYSLIEKQAKEAGLPNVRIRWIDLGGPAVMNDAL